MEKIRGLSLRRFAAVEAFVDGYANAVDIDRNPDSDVVTEDFSEAFGDVLRLHHTVSSEPFTKDKFEYAMVSLLNEMYSDRGLWFAARDKLYGESALVGH